MSDGMLEAVARSFEASRRDCEETIRRMIEGGDSAIYAAAQQAHESFRECFEAFTMQASAIIWDSGKQTPSEQLWRELTASADKQFEQLTGRPYVNATCRHMKLMRDIREEKPK